MVKMTEYFSQVNESWIILLPHEEGGGWLMQTVEESDRN
jgi:hypothetical protein